MFAPTNKQFYETEAYAPLCEPPAPPLAQGILPPSYDDVMASEAAILNKYAKVCKSQACCEHTRFNRCNFEDTSNRNSNNREWNIDRNVNGNGADVKTDAVCKIYENIIYFLCAEYRMFIPSRIYTTHCVFVFFCSFVATTPEPATINWKIIG